LGIFVFWEERLRLKNSDDNVQKIYLWMAYKNYFHFVLSSILKSKLFFRMYNQKIKMAFKN